MFKLNGKMIRIDEDLVIGEGEEAITHPSKNLQDAAYRAALGIEDLPAHARADDRFYLNGDVSTPRPLSEVVSMLWGLIKAYRDGLQEAGCEVGSDWFHNDVKSRTQWERMANRSASMADSEQYLISGQPVPWKTMSGSFVVLTVGKIREVVNAFEAREVNIFAKAEQHKAALLAKGTVEEMIAYDWHAGWPSVFVAEQPS